MYESFFGLRERPFDLAPNPKYLYLAGRHREALSHLRYGLTTPRGFTLLLGEAGTGKTTLVQAVLAELEADKVECVLLSNPTLTRTEFLEFLADGFRLGEESRQSKTRLLAELRQHLETRHAAGQLTALVLDEAQSLPYELLEEVRLLSNMEASSAKLLNVVLAGQPELAGRLNEPGLRQLKQRVSLRCELGPLDLPDTLVVCESREATQLKSSPVRL
jgi:general secretion pathway protein A